MKLAGKNQLAALAFLQRHRGWQTFAIKDRATRMAVAALAMRGLVELAGDQARYIGLPVSKNPKARAKNKGARRNPTRKADHGDREHFHAWTKNRRIRLDFRTAMWKLFSSDPDYWSDKGWSGVFNAVEASGMDAYAVPGKQDAARKNPSAAAIGRADDLLYAFTGGRATKELRVNQPTIKTGLVIGPMTGVMYAADRGDGIHEYCHRFRKSSRPLLITDSDGKQLGIVGGRFRFTDRGITDE